MFMLHVSSSRESLYSSPLGYQGDARSGSTHDVSIGSLSYINYQKFRTFRFGQGLAVLDSERPTFIKDPTFSLCRTGVSTFCPKCNVQN